MRVANLGTLPVPAQGLGCMGMSEYYGPTDWDESVATIRRALDLGVTFLDTADVYGQGHNEVLVGRAVVRRRDEVVLATKFGIDRSGGDRNRRIRGDRAYVRRSCEASLLRLGVEHIDLYYMHRPSDEVAVEETVAAMAELVEQGKVRHLGLSNVDADLVRRAHGVHPIAAVQSEYSLWTRDIETGVVPAMRELGVGLVPYSPLGRGFLTSTIDPATLGPKDFRGRTTELAEGPNEAIAAVVRTIAGELGVAAGQVALAWVYAQEARLGVPVVPIPGTKRVRWLEQNAAALDVRLTEDQLARLDAAVETGVSAPS
jgi:aryl-alcohol dehydrogenase-like predicted oxidoreductase